VVILVVLVVVVVVVCVCVYSCMCASFCARICVCPRLRICLNRTAWYVSDSSDAGAAQVADENSCDGHATCTRRPQCTQPSTCRTAAEQVAGEME
jgi:hypothetical protein